MTNFSFLRGASSAEELVAAAKLLGLAALGVADRNSLAGVVRAHAAAKQVGLSILVGARLVPQEGPEILCFPQDRAAYGRLSSLLTAGKLRAPKGDCHLALDEIRAAAEGQCFVVLPPETLDEAFARLLRDLARAWRGQVWLAMSHGYRGDEQRRLAALAGLAQSAGLPLLAHNDVMMHGPERKPLADILACIREGVTIDQAGFLVAANAERHLKPPEEMARLFAPWPEALAAPLEIVARCRFSLDELKYEYPDEIAPDGRSPQVVLEEETWAGAARRWPGGVPQEIRAQIERELALIRQLDYARFFLTVNDAVRFARGQGILCQGRGSAVNSVVCYCLGISSVDPREISALFERFISAERGEAPDIDVDFEHERREEVIQHIYGRYGRHRAGLAATVICYRTRGAIRDVGKALGLAADTIEALARNVWGWSSGGVAESDLAAQGFDPSAPRLKLLVRLVQEIQGFPRHLSQHVGGFVITKGPLHELVPIENAAMKDRTVIEWDKDDLESLGLLKVDILALGMLTCVRKAFELIHRHTGRRYELAEIKPVEEAVFDMLCRADSLGLFQVESRAQMAMLPRLKPRTYYDLVIQVAIVRPGPIQGDMVHPYLRRRSGKEAVNYPSKELEAVLEKTLGVPLFQEQAMRIAIVAAGFTPGESDRLRRAMATFKNVGTIHLFRDKFIEGMVARGYARDFAERCFKQIEGFGSYGFPESHAAAFAQLVYISAWIKCHYPAVFACALLNSQPMGFYQPAQIVRDAREHGVTVLPVDVNHSEWDCTLEAVNDPPSARRDTGLALRLGFRLVRDLGKEAAEKLVAARGNGYGDPVTLWRRSRLKPSALEALARADAFQSLGLARREALWAVKGLPADPLPLFAAMGEEERGPDPAVELPPLTESAAVLEDYRHLQLTLRAHPASFLRPELLRRGFRPNATQDELPDGARLDLAGLVLVRQRPGEGKVIFATLEDETGIANVVIWPRVFERFRKVVLRSGLLGVRGRLQKAEGVNHLVAETFEDLTPLMQRLLDEPSAQRIAPLQASRDFH